VAAAVQNLLLAATAAGLASYWSSPPVADAPGVLALAGFPEGTQLVAVVYLGWAIRDMEPPVRPPLVLRHVTTGPVADGEASPGPPGVARRPRGRRRQAGMAGSRPRGSPARMTGPGGRLEGRRCLVTGATGIAAATVRRLAAEGAAVHVVSIVEADARDLAAEVGGTWGVADLTDEAQAEAAFSGLDELDALAVVVGGSGRPFGDGMLHDVSLAAWDATIRLNLTTAFLTSREGVRLMRRQGRGGSIVFVASVAAFDAAPDVTGSHTYAAAKAGVIGLSRGGDDLRPTASGPT
jgi:hypothetical protein